MKLSGSPTLCQSRFYFTGEILSYLEAANLKHCQWEDDFKWWKIPVLHREQTMICYSPQRTRSTLIVTDLPNQKTRACSPPHTSHPSTPDTGSTECSSFVSTCHHRIARCPSEPSFWCHGLISGQTWGPSRQTILTECSLLLLNGRKGFQ